MSTLPPHGHPGTVTATMPLPVQSDDRAENDEGGRPIAARCEHVHHHARRLPLLVPVQPAVAFVRIAPDSRRIHEKPLTDRHYGHRPHRSLALKPPDPSRRKLTLVLSATATGIERRDRLGGLVHRVQPGRVSRFCALTPSGASQLHQHYNRERTHRGLALLATRTRPTPPVRQPSGESNAATVHQPPGPAGLNIGATLSRMTSAAGIVALVVVLVPLAIVGAVFVWAARKDGAEDKAVQARLGIRRKTRLGR